MYERMSFILAHCIVVWPVDLVQLFASSMLAQDHREKEAPY